MADNPHQQDNRDRSRVSGSERYEVEYFARQNGISEEQARELIRKFGNDREALNREAQKLKRS